MKSVFPLFVLGFILALPRLSDAKQPAAVAASSDHQNFAIQAQLSASSRRHGVAAHFGSEKAHFWGCTGPCAAGDEGVLTLDIPEEARTKRRRIEVVGTKDDPVMWVRYGTDSLFYSIIVTGAPSGGESAGPELILKGWAGENSEQKTSLKKDTDGGMIVETAPEPTFCGRSAPGQTRMLRPEQGRFVTVRTPALSAQERENAERLVGDPWTASESMLVALEPRGTNSSKTPVDGDRATAWEGAFEYTELKVPDGVDEGRWVVEFATSLSEPTAFYFVVSEKVYQAEFAPSNSKSYVIDLGPLTPSKQASCVALVQPRTPAKVAEIMSTAAGAGVRTTAELVAELENGDPGIADALLRLRGTEAGKELARRYGTMSHSGQVRAFYIAQELPGSAPLPVFARAVAGGGEHAGKGAELLQAAGPDGSQAVLAHLLETEEGEAELIATLTNIDPRFAAHHFPQLLEAAGGERRTQLRDALGGLAKMEEPRGILAGWFSAQSGERKLSPGAEVELLRALEPELVRLPGAFDALERLAESANFARAYLLAPLVVKNSKEVEGSRQILSRFLTGEVSGPSDDQEKAALAVRTLDALLEHGDPSLRVALQGSLHRNLEAENMRVRRAALLNLARAKGTSSEAEKPILDLLSRDAWPQVRAAAALAVLPVAGGTWSQRTERIVLRRLEKDEDATVRRSLVRALGAASGEAVVSGVRRAFEKDKDYSVRAEAAVSLGKLCDMGSIDALTARARQLGTGLTDDGPIELGLSSVTGLAYLTPSDINKRLAPLLSDKASRLTRQQVLRRIEAVQNSSGRDMCRR